jgi:hypothetical protein
MDGWERRGVREAVAEGGKYRKMKFAAGATGELPSPRTAK